MKLVNAALSLLFILFAVVQYNDPDPWIWIVLYGFVALVSAMAFFEKYNKTILVLGMIICIIGIGLLIPDFIDWLKKGAPSINRINESGVAACRICKRVFRINDYSWGISFSLENGKSFEIELKRIQILGTIS